MSHFIPRAALLLSLAASVHAQLVTGRVTGTVADATGAAVPEARVELYLTGGSTPVLTTRTTSEGLFSFAAVRPGVYDLIIEQAGFSRYIQRSLNVDPARETALTAIRLELQATQQTVEVVADAETVQVTNAEVATTVTRQQVENLPVLDRQVTYLVQTQPGVSSGRGTTTINGLRSSFQSMTLDGVNIQDNFIRNNALDYIPNRITIEQVSDVTVATSNASSGQGAGAGQISAVSRGGTNQFHGSLYWYNRNNKFAANDWFNNRDGLPRPFLNQNQLGGSIGGPIKKDKLLFYFNYEAFRNRQQTNVNRTVLLPDARQGIFTYRDPAGTTQRINLLEKYGLQPSAYVNALLQNVPTAFNNFRLGDSRDGFLRNTAGYSFNSASNQDRDQYLARVDYNLSERHTLSGTYMNVYEKTLRPDLSNNFQVVPEIFNENPANFLSTAWRWTAGPTLTNEARFGFNLTSGEFLVSNELPRLATRSGLVFSNPENQWMPQGRTTDTWVVQDNANWVRSTHSVAFGYQGMYIFGTPYNAAGMVPQYDLGFSAVNPVQVRAADFPGGISQQDLNLAVAVLRSLTGTATSARATFNATSRDSGYVAGVPFSQEYKLSNHALYLNDTWRVAPRLTLALGLRWDYWSPLEERNGLILMPAGEGDLLSIMRSNQTLDFRSGPLYKRDWNNFAPNVGVAWDVFGNGRTALRGGYSMSYVNDEFLVAVRSYGLANTGLQQQRVLQNLVSTLDNPVTIDPPAFQVPRTWADNYALSRANNGGAVDPNLRIPYVHQWNAGIQQELWSTIFEIRYVGNKAPNLWRGHDYNQVDIRSNGFLNDFVRAQSNARLAESAGLGYIGAYNADLPGSQPLSVFTQLPNPRWNTVDVQRRLREGEAGDLAFFYQQNGFNGPLNFHPNPYLVNGQALRNGGWSNYNALQIDIRRRVRSDLNFQWNYTFSKALGNTGGDAQTRYENMLDEGNESLEVARSPFDITHQFKANFVYQLPVGRNKRWSTSRWLDHIVGGWMLSGNWIYQSGTPYSIFSDRGTLNRQARSAGLNTASSNLTYDQLKDDVFGFYMTGNGPYFINPRYISAGGRGAEDTPFENQVFFNPGPGEAGNLQRRMFSGPWNFMLDAALSKNFVIREGHVIQFRAEAFNLPNHPSFYVGNETTNVVNTNPSSALQFNINDTNFGTVPFMYGNAGGPRVLQFSLYYRF